MATIGNNQHPELPKRGVVWVSSKGKRGILLESLEETGKYRVLVDSQVIELPARDILPMNYGEEEHSPTEEEKVISQTIALHHLSVRDAVDLLDKKIQRATLAAVNCIKVIHGDEKGKVRRAIHEYLVNCKRVKSFKDDSIRKDTTWVFLHY